MPTTNRTLCLLSALLTVTAFACDAGNDAGNGARAGRGEVEGDSDTDDNSADTDDAAGSDDGRGTGDDCIPSGSVPSGSCDGTSGDGSDDGGQGSSGGDDDEGEADLPYNMNLQLGDSFKLSDAFLEEGPLPAEILSVEMEEGGDWRLTELQTDTEYVVTQEDCDHEGNHGTGRDRIVLGWRNADGSEDSDHMTIRYCD